MLQKGIDVRLPETEHAAKKPEVKITLTIKKDGMIYLEMDQVQITGLERKLEDLYRARADKTLYMKADVTLNYQKVMDVMDICQEAGVESIGLLTEKKGKAEE